MSFQTFEEINLDVARRAQQTFRLQVLDADGTPRDLTGYAALDLTYYVGAYGASPLVTRTIGSGIAITTATTGVIDITLTSSHTDRAPGTYRHELVDRRLGIDRVVFRGTFRIVDTLLSQVV